MEFDHYQGLARLTAIYPERTEEEALAYLALGLAGEVGEVAQLIKRQQRDGQAVNHAQMAAELGDVLWYISEAARQIGVSLEEVAQMNLRKLDDRRQRGALGGSGDKR